MKKVTSIVIGAGLRGGHVYSQYALDHPDEFQVVAVAEPDKERRESFAKRHNIPEELCFESYEELLPVTYLFHMLDSHKSSYFAFFQKFF